MINFDKLDEEYQKISKELSLQETFKDRKRFTKLSKRFSFLEKVLNLARLRESYLKEKKHFEEVLSDSKEEEDIKKLAGEELENLASKIESINEEIEDKIFEDQEPSRDMIIEIRSAAGGEESALFVADLFNMYTRFANAKTWKVEVLSSHPTQIGGFKEMNFSVKGQSAYSYLRFESGVHRVQRVPVTESGGRIHTSTATVAVLIEPKEVELKINPEDLKIDTFRSSGAGGQHVNVTDSAVRITHMPSGTVVTCQDERSQIKNRAKAMRVLKARIMDTARLKEEKKITSQRRIQVGSGERSEKIRTYNFPERRVTDHRINLTVYKLEQILSGDLDQIVKPLIREARRKIYEAKGLV